MSQRRNRIVREIGPVHPINDKNKLMWERYHGPMQAAAAQLNVAIQNTQNMLARIIMESEGFDADKHVFDMDKLVILPRPTKAEGNGA